MHSGGLLIITSTWVGKALNHEYHAVLHCRFVHVSSAGVTRPNRPGINVDQEPPAVKLNDALGGLLTYKLAGEDVVRGSGVPAVVVRPCALTEEPAGAPLEMDQGDVIKVYTRVSVHAWPSAHSYMLLPLTLCVGCYVRKHP